MMLADTFTGIRKSLSGGKNGRLFQEGAGRHRALAPYPSPLDVLAALAPSSSLTIEARDPILLALLAELHAGRDPLWGSLLLLAFEPLIVRVRARLGKPTVARFGRSLGEDLDQRVFAAFVEAAHSLHISSHAARMLRLALERRVWTDQRAERAAPAPAEFDDDTHWADPFETTVRDKAEAHEVVRLIVAEGGEPLKEMMLATRAHRQSLRAFVAGAYPEATRREQASIYRRLTDAAAKTEQKLRTRARWGEQPRGINAA